MKKATIYFASEDNAPCTIEDTNALELDYYALVERYAKERAKINAIEFSFDGKVVGTVLF